MEKSYLARDLKIASQAVKNATKTIGARGKMNNMELKTAVYQLAMANEAIIVILEELLKE